MHEAAKGLLNAGVSYARGDVDGLLSAGMLLFNKVTRGKEAREKTRLTKSSPADVIQLSGCKDYQKSADTVAAVRLLFIFSAN
jgi:metacaspase-1